MVRITLLFGFLLSLFIGKAEAHTVSGAHKEHWAISSWFDYAGDTPQHPKLVAANNGLPSGAVLWVKYPATGKIVRVVVVGTGPFIAGRVLDLSRSAAAKLGYIRAGVVNLQVLAILKPQKRYAYR